jgi:hypothetical protein
VVIEATYGDLRTPLLKIGTAPCGMFGARTAVKSAATALLSARRTPRSVGRSASGRAILVPPSAG